METNKQIAAGKFKAQCLKLMEEVNKKKFDIVITKRGKPVAKLVSLDEKKQQSAFGCMSGTAEVLDHLISSLEGGAADQKILPSSEQSSASNEVELSTKADNDTIQDLIPSQNTEELHNDPAYQAAIELEKTKAAPAASSESMSYNYEVPADNDDADTASSINQVNDAPPPPPDRLVRNDTAPVTRIVPKRQNIAEEPFNTPWSLERVRIFANNHEGKDSW